MESPISQHLEAAAGTHTSDRPTLSQPDIKDYTKNTPVPVPYFFGGTTSMKHPLHSSPSPKWENSFWNKTLIENFIWLMANRPVWLLDGWNYCCRIRVTWMWQRLLSTGVFNVQNHYLQFRKVVQISFKFTSFITFLRTIFLLIFWEKRDTIWSEFAFLVGFPQWLVML